MSNFYNIRKSLLARNAIINLFGQTLPLIIGLITIPFTVRLLGSERFGLLSLAWVILGYAAVFDLGLGRATTKFVAENIGKGEENQTPTIVWTATTIQLLSGLLGTLILLKLTPFLVERILNIPPDLIEEAKSMFYLLAIFIPLVLVSSSFSGVLEANQRFDLLNAVRIPSNIAMFLLPPAGVLLGYNLPGIFVLLFLARVLATLLLFIFCIRIFPKLMRPLRPRLREAYRLGNFGGWITIGNLISPFLRYYDRFVLATLLSTTALAYYSAPFDIIERLWIIPSSLILTLFPAFSALSRIKSFEISQELFLRGVKYILVLITPVILILTIFANPILSILLGKDFGQNSTLILQILAIGHLIGGLAYISGAVVQGFVGRPDITAKLYLAYIPLNIPLVWFLVKSMGLPGAAVSSVLRTTLDTVILLFITLRFLRLSFSIFLKRLLSTLGLVSIISLLAWLITATNGGSPTQLILGCGLILVYFILTWFWIIDEEDKIAVASLLKGGVS